MKVAIVIPTYRPHFAFNTNFLKSLAKYSDSATTPDVFFFTSEDAEATDLRAMVAQECPALAARITVESLAQPLGQVDYEALRKDVDGGFAFGMIGLITLKKFLGLRRAFDRGYDWALIIDSEVVMYRAGDLAASITEQIDHANTLRVSRAAYKNPTAAKAQHDSCRTVDPRYDTASEFAQSFGWYDNLCLFEGRKFKAFIQYLGQGMDDASILNAVTKFRGFAFDWIAYKAWDHFVNGETLRYIYLDDVLIDAGYKPYRVPQTENLYEYIQDREPRAMRVLKGFNPPWLPFTTDRRLLSLLDEGVGRKCCLMFHADRGHRGGGLGLVRRIRRNLARRLWRWSDPAREQT